ncbi:MAG TPA: rhodanese-like domain-containing protein [Planctomycetes bacterium]|nr:rhodanese-like domain-containing protein [Planctomycetota bacterium]
MTTGFFWRLSCLCLAGSLLGLLSNPSSLRPRAGEGMPPVNPYRPAEVDAEDVAAALRKGPLVIIDARSRDEYERLHPAGAIAAHDRGGKRLYRVIRKWVEPKASCIVVGNPSRPTVAALVASRLSRFGFGDVRVLKGGFPAWRRAHLPVAKGWDMEPLMAEGALK